MWKMWRMEKIKKKISKKHVCETIVIGRTNIPGFLKTGLAKISTHSTTWQFKTIKLVQRPVKSLI